MTSLDLSKRLENPQDLLRSSVGYERKFFELERAERKNFRAEPSTSENYRINFRAESPENPLITH